VVVDAEGVLGPHGKYSQNVFIDGYVYCHDRVVGSSEEGYCHLVLNDSRWHLSEFNLEFLIETDY